MRLASFLGFRSSARAGRPARLHFALALLLPVLFALPASAATLALTVAIPSFNSGNIQAFQLNGTSALVGSTLRLTPATTGQAGSAFWKNRINLANKRSFSSYFVLAFPAPGGQDPGGADGIVFTLQTQSNTAGSSGGGIGYEGITPSIGVEFDTWQNAENSDPNANHVGLDVGGSVTSVTTNSVLPGTLEGNTWHIWVDYNGATTNLQVRMGATNDRTAASVVLNVTRDLSSDIGTDVYVGFTGGTGSAYENHDVQSFYFINDYQPIDSRPPTIYTQAPSQVTASPSPASIATGGSSTITATVKDPTGAVMANQTVTFQTSLGNLVKTSAVTNASGQASVTLNGGATAGTATLRATAVGGVYGETTVIVTAPVSIAPPVIVTPLTSEKTWIRPTFTGTAPANVTVVVVIDVDNNPATSNSVTYEVRSSGTGAWSLNMATATPKSGTFSSGGLDKRAMIKVSATSRSDAGLTSTTVSQVYDVAVNMYIPIYSSTGLPIR